MKDSNNPFNQGQGPFGKNPFDWSEAWGGDAQDGNGMPDFGAMKDFSQLKDRIARTSRKALVVFAVIVLVLLAIGYWWFHPAINIHSVQLWEFCGLFILLPLFVLFFGLKHSRGAENKGKGTDRSKLFGTLMWIPVAIALAGVIGGIASLSLIPGNAERYASILQTEDGDFAQDVPEVDYSSIPFIDRDSAVLLGNRTMGTMADYVSQFEISPLYSQINYQGAPVRVSPLNYADIFKWWSNRESGIPGYVIVNMSTQDTQVVRLDDPIRYSDSDPFFKNIDRHVQLSRPFYIYGEKSFEIDEEGNPYWIYPVMDYTIGLFGGQTVSRVVLCDASTGEIQDLAVDEVPQWVDRVYPADLLIRQYNWSGALSGGWINSWLGQNGVKQTTPGSDGRLGYNYVAQDDDVWVYSGVTSATSDNSIIGCVMINQRTAESRFYSVAGATEESAMSSAEGQVQNLRYSATFPLLINVDGVPTYFMALKDNAGLVKMYAMVDIERYQNVAVGDTLAATEKSYQAMLRANGINAASSSTGGSMEQSGRSVGSIASINPVVLDGNSHYYILLDGDSLIYDFPVASVVDVVRFKVGDSVSVEYTPGATMLVSANAITAA